MGLISPIASWEDIQTAMFRGAIVLAAAALVGTFLQGCGCDEDKGKKCITDAASKIAAGGANVCTSYADQMKCLDDASCCDHDDIKKSVDSCKTQKPIIDALGGCTLDCKCGD